MSRLLALMRHAYQNKVPIVPSLISKLIRVLYSCDIKPSCDIHPQAILMHGGLGCVFHENVVVEQGAKIYQNVTLGGNGKDIEVLGTNHPVVQKGAIIYAGACVLGPINVGENSIVGANAVVLNDVPPNSVAVGVPARIIKRERTA